MATKRDANVQEIINWIAGFADIDTCSIEENCGTLWVETDEGCYAVSAMMTEGDDD